MLTSISKHTSVQDLAPKTVVVSPWPDCKRTIDALGGLDTIWINLESPPASMPLHVSALIIDAPLKEEGCANRISAVLRSIPSATPRLFVIDKAQRIEVVRATVLGATALVNRPLCTETLESFLSEASVERREAYEGMQAIASATASLNSLFDSVRSGGRVDLVEVDETCDAIASSLNSDGLEGWLRTVRDHHEGTLQHCLIVAGVMTNFGQSLGMSRTDVHRLTRVGLLHDVGKAHIPTEVLDKPGRLSDEEFEVIKTHPHKGFMFLQEQKILGQEELDAVVGHHEYLDGTGYPYGLSGTSIGDLVRITTVCDVYGALIEKRSYKAEMPSQEAISILSSMATDGKVESALVGALRRSVR